MLIDVFTLFPEHFDWFLRQRHVSNALFSGTEIRFRNYRDTTPLSAGQVDDAPYGGGAGMVMRPEPIAGALRKLRTPDSTVLLTYSLVFSWAKMTPPLRPTASLAPTCSGCPCVLISV